MNLRFGDFLNSESAHCSYNSRTLLKELRLNKENGTFLKRQG